MSTTLSCGQCGAPLRPEQGWCSLCYASVQPSFDPLTAPLDEVEGYQENPVRASTTVPEVVSASPMAAPTPQFDIPEVTDVEVMLSMLAAEHRQNDPAAGLAERFGDKSTRMMVMFGGMFAIGLVGFLLLTVLGAIF